MKNISGRFLVGLRWWSFIDDQGNEKWVFESRESQETINDFDSTVFWYSQMGTSLFWILITLWEIMWLRLFWGILALFCCCLAISNLYAYHKCNAKYRHKVEMYKEFGATFLKMLRERMSESS